ncbi:MAG: GxxExxY protein [Candidatus Berkelbacteria bacterium]|nr:GxxExxY protein [Candidatus Berkelbacteria bacterium]
MTELLYKELSFKLTGLVYEIDNLIGYGQSEKIYCDCFEKLLQREKINYEREIYFPLRIDNKVIKKYYFDFLIDDSIIIEFKISDRNYKNVCTQIFQYLKSSGKKLGIVFRFMSDGVRVKRIPNYY